MDDYKLDSLLKKAKDQSDRFFAGWAPQLHPQQVQARHKERKCTRYLFWFRPWKPGVVAVGLLILVFAIFNLTEDTDPSPAVYPNMPLYGFNQVRYAGYEDPVISMLLAEDFIVQGDLAFRDGVLVEERASGMVTRIIPYQMNPYGELVLATERVLLQVGEELLLVGVNLPHYVELSAGNYNIKKVNERGNGYISETRFSVRQPGEDLLQLTPLSDPTKKRTIYIKVIH